MFTGRTTGTDTTRYLRINDPPTGPLRFLRLDSATYAATTRSTGLQYYTYQQPNFRKTFVVRNYLLP
jgi:hypothetical protein